MPAMRINKEESSMGYIFLEFFASKTEGILNETETITNQNYKTTRRYENVQFGVVVVKLIVNAKE